MFLLCSIFILFHLIPTFRSQECCCTPDEVYGCMCYWNATQTYPNREMSVVPSIDWINICIYSGTNCTPGMFSVQARPPYYDPCAKCQAGYFCPGTKGGGHFVCPGGYSCNEGNLDRPFICPSDGSKGGTFSPYEKNDEKCSKFLCNGGYFCPVGSYNEKGHRYLPETFELETQDRICSRGYYCKPGSYDEMGRINIITPLILEEYPHYCEAGYYCPEGSYTSTGRSLSFSSQRECDMGYYCPEGSYDKFGRTIFNDTVKDCPAGYYCGFGEFEPTHPNRKCRQGYYCEKNSVSEFGQTVRDISVHPCKKGYYCSEGSVSERGGDIVNPDNEKLCAHGYYCDEKSMTERGWTEIEEEDHPCDAGFYCELGSIDSLGKTVFDQGIKRCQRGYFCEEGSFSGDGRTIRQNESHECYSGYYCPEGSRDEYGRVLENDDPRKIVEYHYCGGGCWNETGHGECLDGYFCPEGSRSPSFMPCMAGSYCVRGQSFKCRAGTFSMEGYVKECYLCPAGYYCPFEGMTNETGAGICDAGYYCPEGSSNARAELCPKGHYCNDGLPVVCSPGTYQQNEGVHVECLLCPKGYECPNSAMINPIDCDSSSYCPEGTIRRVYCECSGKGSCPYNPTLCECFEGYTGDQCEIKVKPWIEKNWPVPVFSVIGTVTVFVGCLLVLFWVCCCCLVCTVCCGCLIGFIWVGRIVLHQRTGIRRYQKLKDFDVLLQEQLLDDDPDMASLKINKDMFRIPYEEVKILEMIGKGGSGSVVFKGVWQNSLVAFKCFKTKHVCSSQHTYDEFEKEVMLFSSIAHPSIVRFFGASLKTPRVGIVMEFCSNGSLIDFLKNYMEVQGEGSETYPIEEKCRMLLEVASSMNYLSNRSVIHRDLKCENVLVDELERCKLMDFGLSRFVRESEQENTNLTKNIGTGVYMAPEVVRGDYDEKCDVYSFSILTWIVITENNKPYGKKDFLVEYKVVNDPDMRPPIGDLENSVRKENDAKSSLKYEFLIYLVQDAWNQNPELRPTFSKIIDIFNENGIKPQRN